MHEKKVTSDLGGGGSESRLIAKINHLQQIFTRQVEAAHLFFICILHIQVVFTFFDNLLQKKVCRYTYLSISIQVCHTLRGHSQTMLKRQGR